MLDEHNPRMWKTFLAVAICVLACVCAVKFPAYKFPALVAAGFAAVAASVETILVSHVQRLRAIEVENERLEILQTYSPEQWNALGLAYLPHIRWKWRGRWVEFFDECNEATVNDWIRFVRESRTSMTGISTSPERDWRNSTVQLRKWNELVNVCLAHDWIYPDSAAGNHSFLWRAKWYQLHYEAFAAPKFEAQNYPSPSESTPPLEAQDGDTDANSTENSPSGAAMGEWKARE